MKFNNQLNIESYVGVTSEIVSNFFDKTNGEYLPHFGNIYTVYVYFMNCVESEPDDIVTKDTIITTNEDGTESISLIELQKLFDDEDFMRAYNSATMPNRAYALDFGHAHADAIRIVKSRSANNNPLIFGITELVKTFNELFTSEELAGFLKAFTDSIGSINDDTVTKLTDTAKEVMNGNLSAQAIVNAYNNNLSLVEDKE